MAGQRVDPTARLRYDGAGLDDGAVAALRGVPPLTLLERWYAHAAADERIAEPGAMVVATTDPAGHPNARTVLLKGLDPGGLVFFTNLASTKAAELDAAPYASLVLLWHPMFRQVRARGPVEPVSREESATYFGSRPRESQVAAWASRQSQPIASRAELEAAVRRRETELGDADVPLPDFWGGYRVRPVEVELWVGHRDRLHDRVAFTSSSGAPAPLDDAAAWQVSRLQP
ncbi:MAG TPA: pyridoxamine 5'-phosphate oxidase [Actinomycetales bacterium]|nr:pyridoxamine 5'-phosphate oxidase [Actinomycetales bacterium]